MNLEQLLQQAREKRKALHESIKKAASIEELDKIELDIRKEDLEIKTLDQQIQMRDAGGDDPEARNFDNTQVPGGAGNGLNPLATFRQGDNQEERSEEEDMFASLEYRQAFRNYMIKGTPIPEKFKGEERADSLTLVGDVAAVIPTTIANKVIEDLTVEGKILSKITQTSFQGGVDIPISEINPEAKWIADGTDSDEQKAKMSAKLSFGYHLLEAKVAVGILSATVALPVFEATIVKSLKKAMIRAIETAIVSGTGSGQPLGFTKIADLPATSIVELDESEVGTVKGWAKVEAAVQEAYDTDSLSYMMSKVTWDTEVNSMVDSTGQKIGLGRINEKGTKVLNGREVLTCDKFKGFASAVTGDIIGALVDLEQYLLNSNLQMYFKKYWDEDTNKYKYKALMIADGKMCVGKDSANKVVGAGSVILIKKKVKA